MVGVVLGLLLFPLHGLIGKLLQFIRLPAAAGFWHYICAGALGGFLHVPFDAVLYSEMNPFFPLNGNPFFGLMGYSTMYLLCVLLVFPALLIYLVVSGKKQG